MCGYRFAGTVTVATIFCLMQGSVVAGPLSNDGYCGSITMSDSLPRDVKESVPVELTPVAMIGDAHPVAAAPTRQVDRITLEPGERTRLISFVILRSLREAGPFLGGAR